MGTVARGNVHSHSYLSDTSRCYKSPRRSPVSTTILSPYTLGLWTDVKWTSNWSFPTTADNFLSMLHESWGMILDTWKRLLSKTSACFRYLENPTGKIIEFRAPSNRKKSKEAFCNPILFILWCYMSKDDLIGPKLFEGKNVTGISNERILGILHFSDF